MLLYRILNYDYLKMIRLNLLILLILISCTQQQKKHIVNEKPIINTPGENGFELPVKYEIADPVEIDLGNIRNFRKYIMENLKYCIYITQ